MVFRPTEDSVDVTVDDDDDDTADGYVDNDGIYSRDCIAVLRRAMSRQKCLNV